MNPFALSGLLTGITSLAFGYFVYLKGSAQRLHKLWFLFTISVAVWGFGGMWIALAESKDEALLAWRLAFACGVVWIPILFYHFVHVFSELHRNRFLLFSYAVGIVFLPVVFTDLIFSDVRLAFSSFYYSMPGPLFPIFFLWWVGTVIIAHYELLRKHRQVTSQKRNQIKYFFLATAIGYSGGSLDYLPIFGIDLYPYGNFAIVLYPMLMTYAILKYRLMDITVAMEKGLTYLLLLIVVGVPSYPVLLAFQETFFGTISHPFSITLFLLFALLFLAAYRIKSETQWAIARIFFKNRYDFTSTLSAFSKVLVTILDLKTLTEEIVRTLTRIMDIKTASLYLLDREKGTYVLISSHGLNPDRTTNVNLRSGDGLPLYHARHQSVLVRGELERMPSSAEVQSVVDALKAMEAEVCIPFVNKDRVIGFCNLGPREDDRAFSDEDLNLLTTLGQNAAIALDNAVMYEDLKRSQALMRRTDRLRSLETIAGGFAHEVRNPLTSIKTFVELAPERKDDPEFIGPFTRVVLEDVYRIERLIQEILDYARYMQPQFAEEDLNQIVSSCLHFIEVKADNISVMIEKHLDHTLPPVKVDRQQIKQVLMNLLLNALDAMGDRGGRLIVKTHLLAKQNVDPCVQIEISDTGCGIDAENLDHIFDPFYTTKYDSDEREGTGLGLTIAHQIVQEHRGYIEVKSEMGRGTTFFVNLPVMSTPVEPREGKSKL